MLQSMWNQVHHYITCGYRSDTNETDTDGCVPKAGGHNSSNPLVKMFSSIDRPVRKKSQGNTLTTLIVAHFFLEKGPPVQPFMGPLRFEKFG